MSLTLNKDAQGAYRQQIHIGPHTLLADLPVALGGDDAAPDPHALFDASLAACKALTATMVARRRQWPLEGIDITLTRDDSQEREGQYRLQLVLDFLGDLTDAQRQSLLEIADKCPVHRLMTQATIHVDSRLA